MLGSIEPRACSAGTYSASPKSATCNPCKPATFQEKSGQIACDDVSHTGLEPQTSRPLDRSATHTCEPCFGQCGAGFYCPRGSISKTPIACNPGSYVLPNMVGWTGQDNCTTCPETKWCPGGSSQPKKCAGGSKGNLTGLANCFACDAGKYQDAQGQSDCKECELGGYCTESTVVPTRCAPGTFGNRTGREVQADCFLCPAGSACERGAEVHALCPAGTFANVSGMPNCL